MRQLLTSLLFALMCALLFAGAAGAQRPDGDRLPRGSASQRISDEQPAISLQYAQVSNGGAAVYASPSDAASGIGPIDWLGSGFVFVSLADAPVRTVGGVSWYHLDHGGYVAADRLLPYSPSRFKGVQLAAQPDKPFAWVLSDSQVSNAPGAKPLASASHLTRYTLVTLLDRQDVSGSTWYRVGESAWLSQYRLGIVSISQRPPAVDPSDKWIEVNLYEQTLSAYEGDQLVYATLLSSGLPKWPTNPGLFKIYEKVRQDKMSGDEGQPDYYYLQDIPWIMYFDNDQALHTAYWHDGFGAPHSHGCVNLSPEDALWLYNWTGPYAGSDDYTFSDDSNPGTWVWVHE